MAHRSTIACDRCGHEAPTGAGNGPYPTGWVMFSHTTWEHPDNGPVTKKYGSVDLCNDCAVDVMSSLEAAPVNKSGKDGNNG